MDFILTEDGRRGNRQVKPRRQDYPLWGIEEPRREWNGHSYYRHGVKDPLDRYLIKPRPTPLLCNGLTVLDVLVGIGVGLVMAPLVLLFIDIIGIGWDGYLDAVGY